MYIFTFKYILPKNTSQSTKRNTTNSIQCEKHFQNHLFLFLLTATNFNLLGCVIHSSSLVAQLKKMSISKSIPFRYIQTHWRQYWQTIDLLDTNLMSNWYWCRQKLNSTNRSTGQYWRWWVCTYWKQTDFNNWFYGWLG